MAWARRCVLEKAWGVVLGSRSIAAKPTFPLQAGYDDAAAEAQEGEENIELLDHADGQAGQGGGPRQRITTRYMTKYEKARVLGTRALQIR